MATVLHVDTRPSVAPADAGLTALEREIVAVFADIGQALGMPKSYGEIYGLLYASADPLSFADIETKLELSKGSVSQGLKALREIGAVRRTEYGELRTEDRERTEPKGGDGQRAVGVKRWPAANAEGDSERVPSGRESHNTADGGRMAARSRDYFVPETELRQLVAAILREGIAPRLKANAHRLTGMPELLRTAKLAPAERKLLSGRIEKLQGWRRKASGLLPWITKFLG